MKLLNVGCGGERPGWPWINMDAQGTGEINFIQHSLTVHPLPFDTGSIDGMIASHVFEHFDAHNLQHVLRELYRILKPGGVLRCSVPDATHFRKVQAEDNRANAERLFGEPLRHPGYSTFMGWALFLYAEHLQVFTEDSLWCTLVNWEYEPKKESFKPENVYRTEYQKSAIPGHYCSTAVAALDNRPVFSLFMEAFK